MSDEQHWNSNEWAQPTQDDYLQAQYYHYHVPDGYAPVHGYAPVEGQAPSEAQNGYSDYQTSTAGPSGTHLIRDDNSYAVEGDDVSEEEVREFVSSRQQKRKSKSHAMPKAEQPKSKRAHIREKIAADGLEPSAKDQPKGLVEWREGVFQWWDPTNKDWLKAAYHDQFRDQFIREDATEGNYIVPPARGKGANDITSACSAFNQLEWRLADRDSWHNIADSDGNKVLYLIDRPAVQTYQEPERLWYHNGCVLLDGDNNPVRPWANVPRCFSSKLEGGRIEALRRILPMTIQDFRARCLRAVPTGDGTTKPLSYPSTFGHRSSRFRTQYQTPAWIARAASAVLKKQITDLLPEAEEATSTEGLQVLSKYEIAQRKSATRGKFLYKATGRAISDQERQRRDSKLNQRLERQAASQPSTPRRLQSAPVTPWQSTSQSPYLPTPPLSAGNKRRRDDVDDYGKGDIGQSESAAKRGRLGASPRDPRLQSRLPAPQTSPEDQAHQAPNAYDPTSIFSTINWQHGLPDSSAAGLGLDSGGVGSVDPQNLAQSENTDVSEPLRHSITSTNASRDEHNFQVDLRFVEPRNSFDQLSIRTALFYPLSHYQALTGKMPPRTSEGSSYSHQYLQILTALEENWDNGRTPVLADVGPWFGSFSTVPIPDLPDTVRETLLHPDRNSGLKEERESNGWVDDLFAEYIEDTAEC